MSEHDEYAVTKEDVQGGGGGGAKPRGKYSIRIEKAESKKDKNNKIYLSLQGRITHGKRKNGVIFDNYLPLGADANAFQKARRNSLYRALGLKEGEFPPGTPKGRPASDLNGTFVDVTLEHEFNEVPGEQYAIQTSKSAKSRWKTEEWEKGLDDKGNLVRSPGGTEYEAPVQPKEFVTFYELSDDFIGIGDPDAVADEPVDDSADEDWG
ncbi:hypothetical protein SEA_JACKO_69 [Microbacterium phage Jacko]|nr:hypothetical protein SEA_JACKO_69 [Microbacterium phage Jacko]